MVVAFFFFFGIKSLKLLSCSVVVVFLLLSYLMEKRGLSLRDELILIV